MMKKCILFFVLVSLMFCLYPVDVETELKLDLGKNVTDMLQELSKNLGIGIKHLYPMYVNRIRMEAEAAINLYYLAGLILLLLIIISGVWVYIGFSNKKDIEFRCCVCAIFCLILLMISIIFIVDYPELKTRTHLPEAYAIHDIMKDIKDIKEKN